MVGGKGLDCKVPCQHLRGNFAFNLSYLGNEHWALSEKESGKKETFYSNSQET